jgi:FkbM family methyltransferase
MSLIKAIKRELRKTLRSYGLEVLRTPSLYQFLASRDIDIVLDVGANIGQFAMQLRESGYTGLIISFEPVFAVFEQLRENCKDDPLWEARNYALGAETGNLQINVSKYSVFSSILNQTAKAIDFDERAKIASIEKIKVVALDDFFVSEFAEKSIFMKIDTQGFEQHVLRGALQSLRQIKGIQLEIPVVHLYENTWTLEAAVAEMKELGFTIAQVRPVNVLHEDSSSIVELDCIFRQII